jgi:hypothetical protein
MACEYLNKNGLELVLGEVKKVNDNLKTHETRKNVPGGFAGLDVGMNLASQATPINTTFTTGITQGSYGSRYMGWRVFTVNNPNEKFDIVLPLVVFGGVIEIEIASGWNMTNATGGITKRFAVMTGTAPIIHSQNTVFTNADPNTSRQFAISDMYIKNGRQVITVAQTVDSTNGIWVRMSAMGENAPTIIASSVLSDTYTDDPIIYPPATLHPLPVWHSLVLQNGVTSVVTPQVCKIGNIVFMRGVLSPNTASAVFFTTLPIEFRPVTAVGLSFPGFGSAGMLLRRGIVYSDGRIDFGIGENTTDQYFINASFVAGN